MKNIKIGAIGCGGMGLVVIKLLLNVDKRLHLSAVYDPDERSVKKALEEIKPAPKVYDSYQALLADSEIDWVMIASWNCYHAEQTIAAFAAGKNVFCQKPLATNLDECKKMYDAWKKSGKLFNIGFTLRYSPHYRKLKKLISENAVGKIVSMEFNETLNFNHGGYIHGDWRRLRKFAGTHLLEKCCHDIDLVNWFVESRASRVASFGGNDFFIPENEKHIERIGKNKDGLTPYTTWPGLVAKNPFTSEKDIVDNQVAIIEFENKTRATFHTNCNAGIPERRMYILGTEGAIRANVLTGKIEMKKIGFDTQIEDVSSEASGGHGGGDEILTAELADAMLNGATPAAGLKEGLEASVVSFAIDDALDTGKVIDLKSYWEKVGIFQKTI